MLPCMKNALKRHRIFTSNKSKIGLSLKEIKMDFCEEVNLVFLAHGPIALIEQGTYPVKTDNSKRDGSYGQAVFLWPGEKSRNYTGYLSKCLILPFPPKPLMAGDLESTLFLCPQTMMCLAGHWKPPFAKCLLA